MATKAFIRGVALGAGLTYLFDPENGKQRRENSGRSSACPKRITPSLERRSSASGQSSLHRTARGSVISQDWRSLRWPAAAHPPDSPLHSGSAGAWPAGLSRFTV